MPVYQYHCAGCNRSVDVFFRSVSSVGDPVCPECGGRRLTRLVSRFARTRSASERLGAIDFRREMGRLRSGGVGDFARWSKRLGDEYDGELGSNFAELAERAEAGEDPVERVDPGHTLRYQLEKRAGEIGGSGDGAGSPSSGGGSEAGG